MESRVALCELFGDSVVYRDLNVMDERVPRFTVAYAEMGLERPIPPRKLEAAYARALAWLLNRSQALTCPGRPLREMIYIGDTMLNDVGAFGNLRNVAGWPGWCFIGAEKDEESIVHQEDGIYRANRWSALAQFLGWAQSQGGVLDACTAVVVDIDKTLLGARGRNDGAIDRARIAAIEATAAAALGPAFDQGAFRRAYAELNTPAHHAFTGDNQDIIAYICLVLSAGFGTLEGLLADLAEGRVAGYLDLMARIDGQRARLEALGLAGLHNDIHARVRAGDHTPFKAFRRREYLETVGRMGHLPAETPLAQRLVEEICLTREVYEAVQWLKRRGCLLMAFSDKPDEATVPAEALFAQGYLALHRTVTHVIGQSIVEALPP